ncbi:MAG: hypothetical protein J5527_01165 [Treponema sp.]|nr:hypothetical protein [Treponema sp.]
MILIFGFISCSTTDNVNNTRNSEIAIQNEIDALNAQNEIAEASDSEEQNMAIASEVNIEETLNSTEEVSENTENTENPADNEAQAESSSSPDENSMEVRTAGMTEEQKKFYCIKYTYDYEVIGRDLDYKIMVNDETKQVIIQFEETDCKEDWVNNYLFIPWPLKLDNKIVWTTLGYARVYKSAKDVPFNEFYKQIQEHPDYQIVIWGWSFGSAMAKIVARHFSIRTGGEVLIDELTTFGDVKCWYNPFYSVKKHCKKIREYVQSNDMITWCIPLCRRDVNCRVGDRFSLLKLKNSENYHISYENCDYSEW